MFIYVLFLFLFLATGCAGAKLMVVDKEVNNVSLPNNQAAIIFIRPVNYGISVPIAEYKNNDFTFIGNTSPYTAIMHITTPGTHEYVVAGGSSDILKANLKAGMYYYVFIAPEFDNANYSSRARHKFEVYEKNKNKVLAARDGEYQKVV